MNRDWVHASGVLRISGIQMINGEHAPPSAVGHQPQLDALELNTGEITVLMGANGAGKTRLMEKIAGLRGPGEVSIQYGREPLWVSSRTSIRGKKKLNPKALLAYAYACQSPEEQLFLRTVREELAYSLRPYDNSLPAAEKSGRIASALAAVSWDGTWLERDPYVMSGGERRRTALACLFAPPADWLLLDEPTAGLDAEGHELLGAKLRRCASDGQGVLLISHESDWAFGLADRILLLHGDGSVRSCDRSELLANPGWLTEAGMNVPDWFGIAHLSLQLGVNEPDVWDASKLAAALAGRHRPARTSAAADEWDREAAMPAADPAVEASQAAIRVGDSEAKFAAGSEALSAASQAAMPTASSVATPTDSSEVMPAAMPSTSSEATPSAAMTTAVSSGQDAPPALLLAAAPRQAAPTDAAPARKPFALRASAALPSPIAAFDARAVWLTYIILSTFMLRMAGWRSIGLAAAFVACAIYFGRIPLRRWRGAIRAIATFTVAVSIIAGFGRHPSGAFWDMNDALVSLRSLLKPLLVMLLGFGLPIAVTPLRLRRSLEQLFTAFGRMPAWGTKLLLTVTLLLRFVPVLLSEWERFARIAAARGKKTGHGWRGAVRRIQETALPFMLSLFRLGDQVTDALESRGVGVQPHPTVLVTEAWRLRDTLLVAAGAAAGLILLLNE